MATFKGFKDGLPDTKFTKVDEEKYEETELSADPKHENRFIKPSDRILIKMV